MKDHEIRELVNQLRDVAIKYHGAGQLREQIARTVRAHMLQENAKSAGESNNCRSGENVQDLQDGNCRENGNSSTKHFREISETSTNRSREHFISLCNEFWNWQELDDITAGEEEPRLGWDGEAFTHRITKALWRMYQTAPGNSPVIPDGYVMVPKEPTPEILAVISEAIRAMRGSAATYARVLAAAPQEVKGE